MKYTSLLDMIRHTVRVNQQTKAHEQLHKAVEKDAQLRSDAMFAERMFKFYQDKSEGVTPSLQWWLYAEYKQKAYEYAETADRLYLKAEASREEMHARDAALAKLIGGEK